MQCLLSRREIRLHALITLNGGMFSSFTFIDSFRPISVAIKGRPRATLEEDKSPGPRYTIPTAAGLFKHPCYSKPAVYHFSTCPRKTSESSSLGPGPCNYDTTPVGRSAPSYSMRGRTPLYRVPISPGSYNLDLYKNRGPAFSIKGRLAKSELKAAELSPGSGAYEVANYKGNTRGPGNGLPKWSFGYGSR